MQQTNETETIGGKLNAPNGGYSAYLQTPMGEWVSGDSHDTVDRAYHHLEGMVTETFAEQYPKFYRGEYPRCGIYRHLDYTFQIKRAADGEVVKECTYRAFLSATNANGRKHAA